MAQGAVMFAPAKTRERAAQIAQEARQAALRG
jgi:hypothetical protein